MAIRLPYNFDTSGVVKLIIRGVLGVLAIVWVGVGYSLLISHDRAAALQLLLCAVIVAYFGRVFLRNLTASTGTITADTVVVQPAQLFGIRLASPGGRFAISQFQAVRVDRVTSPISVDTQIGPHERVHLVGKQDTPDILVARTDGDAGRALGHELAIALRLPYQEQVAPY